MHSYVYYSSCKLVSPFQITVFKPFFVTLNLPYSIIRGEEFALQALVFNYLQDDMEVCQLKSLVLKIME